ncbi:hypothetical protein BC941DRAFT_445931 [Chlamydoabsidia padenii]|nr:hypothetical protein BC941DRAFT_445931 [Chlamydoabsidia padenii]
MSHSKRSSRIRFIQTMKTQLQLLIKLKENQDRSRRSHRRNMHQVNSLYLTTRTDELPDARNTYMSKWEEIDRLQSSPILTPPFTPSSPSIVSGPQHAVSPSRTFFSSKNMAFSKSNTTNMNILGDFSEISSLSSSTSNDISHQALYSGDDQPSPPIVVDVDAASITSVSQIVAQNKFDLSPPPPSPQKRIHQFMKSFQNNPDPAKQNLRLAKLKAEMNEADIAYRQVIRKMDILTRKQKAANELAIKALQSQLLEKSIIVKQVLDQVLETEADYTYHENETIRSMQSSLIKSQPIVDQDVFNNLLSDNKYPMPSPIYYINHQVGECKNLLFGITLVEYSQRKGQSPPLILSRCIEAVEKLGGLEKEGIYRVSGKKTSIEKIKQSFERDEEAALFGQNDIPEEVYCIASVIKIFLRELAAPLFPFNLADRITYSQIPDKELRLMNLLTRILKLPGPNYDTLKVVVCHLSKLEPMVEKNRMTISNLSMIFTPAIFQDHNYAEASLNEWKKDSVLEDLLVNANTLFADKDLRGASAITGVIDYGFEKANNGNHNNSEDILFVGDEEDFAGEKDEYHLPTPDSPSTYPTTYISPPSSTIKAVATSLQGHDSDKEADTIEPDIVPAGTPPLSQSTSRIQNSNDNTVPESSISTLLNAKVKRNSKFRNVSQDLGLTVITQHSSVKKSGPVNLDNNPLVREPNDPIISRSYAPKGTPISPSIQSATVPSFDFSIRAPEFTDSSRSSLRRSATTGRTPLSKRNKGYTTRVPIQNGSSH